MFLVLIGLSFLAELAFLALIAAVWEAHDRRKEIPFIHIEGGVIQ